MLPLATSGHASLRSRQIGSVGLPFPPTIGVDSRPQNASTMFSPVLNLCRAQSKPSPLKGRGSCRHTQIIICPHRQVTITPSRTSFTLPFQRPSFPSSLLSSQLPPSSNPFHLSSFFLLGTAVRRTIPSPFPSTVDPTLPDHRRFHRRHHLVVCPPLSVVRGAAQLRAEQRAERTIRNSAELTPIAFVLLRSFLLLCVALGFSIPNSSHLLYLSSFSFS